MSAQRNNEGDAILGKTSTSAERINREAAILVVSSDIPYPPVTGGRADVWTRIKALRAANINVNLLCWYDAGRVGDPSPEAFLELRSVCREVRAYPIHRTFGHLSRRAAMLWRLPSHAAARVVATPLSEVRHWVRRLDIDAVLLDGLYGGEVARVLVEEQETPLLYRSHNIEHVYMRGQYCQERVLLRRLGLAANLLHLRRFETEIMKAAFRVFDISMEDAQFWARTGVTSGVDWVPPIVDMAYSGGSPKEIDVLFFGNLHTPNNVDAIRWLVLDVLPRCAPVRTVIIAGSNPTPDVRNLIHLDPRITLIENPSSVVELMEMSKVLVNPTRFSSGINIKSVEMLFSDSWLVSTAAGIKGLPAEAQVCFNVRNDAIEFANAINAGVEATHPVSDARHEARRYFSPETFPCRVVSAIEDWRLAKAG